MKPLASKRVSQLLFAITITSFAAGQPYTFVPSGRFVLRASSARQIFRQCSRQAPSAKSELWEPSAEDLDGLEALLPRYLDERERTGKANPPKSIAYHRQYVGFVDHGERFIYGNFYPGEIAGVYESRDAVRVCDGGPVFWGIVYRVKTKTFEQLRFNGRA